MTVVRSHHGGELDAPVDADPDHVGGEQMVVARVHVVQVRVVGHEPLG